MKTKYWNRIKCEMFIVFCLTVSALNVNADSENIGSGYLGLKVITGMERSNSIVIYQDTPPTVGGVIPGKMEGYSVKVIYERGYHFSEESLWGGDIPIPEQLYPFSTNSAFTSRGGTWDFSTGKWQYSSRTYVGYFFASEKLIIFTSVQERARALYHLNSDDVFLGAVDGKSFFWKKFKPSKIFWRDQNSQKEFYYALPRGIIDIYGVTKGIQKDVQIRVFRKSSGFMQITPYEPDSIEIFLSKGKLVRSDE
jgi:hypothetical protein